MSYFQIKIIIKSIRLYHPDYFYSGFLSFLLFNIVQNRWWCN